jgi:mitochondrial fission protein ELM1
MATATHHLIEHQLKGRSLRGLVFTARRTGRSWQSIANEVRDLTGVIVSRETLRNWYPDAPARGDWLACSAVGGAPESGKASA